MISEVTLAKYQVAIVVLLSKRASSSGGHRFIVEEVETTTKAERVVVLVVVDVALRLSPEIVGVLRDGGARRGRRLIREEGVWLHFAELSGGKTCSSVR